MIRQSVIDGGALSIEPGAPLAGHAVLFGLGLAMPRLPPLVGTYLLLIA